jgi:rubrerythrin
MYTMLLNLLLILGLIGVFILAILSHAKLAKLSKDISEMKKQNEEYYQHLSNYLKDSSANHMKQQEKDEQLVDHVYYSSQVHTEDFSLREEELIEEKVKQLQESKTNLNEELQPKIGIVFCRNCASQYTSDKEACPICGASRP